MPWFATLKGAPALARSRQHREEFYSDDLAGAHERVMSTPRGQPRPAALRKSIRGAQRNYSRQIRLGQVFGSATKRSILQTARRGQPHSQDRHDERHGLEQQHGASRSRAAAKSAGQRGAPPKLTVTLATQVRGSPSWI